MIAHKLLPLLKIAFGLLFVTVVILHKRHSPRILIIHSYHAEYSWVKEENDGVARFLGKHPEVNVRWHYMDLKNHTDPDFQRAAAHIATSTIERWRPDVLVIFDDIAQELVGTRYVNHPRIKLVFGGVNAAPEKYRYRGAANVTGILERKPLQAIDDTIRMLWRSMGEAERPPRALLLGDASFDFAAAPGTPRNCSPFQDNCFAGLRQCRKTANAESRKLNTGHSQPFQARRTCDGTSGATRTKPRV